MKMSRKRCGRAVLLVCGFVLCLVSGAQAVLDAEDAGIINLYLLNEASSGQLNNVSTPAFYDTAPTGTSQNHDGFNDFPSDGPQWGGGTDFEINGVPVGTGTGLIFDAGGWDRTRAMAWHNVGQGNYTNGGSFTIMVRGYFTEALDGEYYGLYCNGLTSYLRLSGTSHGTLNVQGTVRDGAPNEYWWNVNSGIEADPQHFVLDTFKWYNVFLIYHANTSLTVAADDGTSLVSFISTTVPTGFDSITDGFSDSGNPWNIGGHYNVAGVFDSWLDGRIESIAVWDKPLSLAEADAIGFDTYVPEPPSVPLNLSDTDIINLYTFDEQSSGQLENTPDPQFFDTAVTGTSQNHSTFNDFPSDGPAWTSGLPVGTGNGLTFDRADNDRTRAEHWLDVPQGDYTQGSSFTIMARVKLNQAVDGNHYTIYGMDGYETLAMEGMSTGQLLVKSVVRDGTANGGSEVRWYGSSGDNSNDEFFALDPNTWYNVFLIYEANTSVTVAAKDSATFKSNTNSTVPAGFDSLTHLFSDSGRNWFIGSYNSSLGNFDGIIESIVVWDRALSLEEAEALNLQNIQTPTDCASAIEGGYQLTGDINGDCHVNIIDLSTLVSDWLQCNDPAIPGCVWTW